MSKTLRIRDYLQHIRDAIVRISDYLSGMNSDAFSKSRLTQDATVRNLEIIDEVARNILRVDPKFAERHPDFPLGKAIGMRNTWRMDIST